MAKVGNAATPIPVARSQSARGHLIKSLYTAPELMRVTGMTRKQVGYWARIGLVVPAFRNPTAGTGKPAMFYNAAQALKALIVCELRRAGFTLRQVQLVAENLEEHGLQLDESEAYLLTDGYSVYYALSDDEVVDVLKHRRQMLLLVPIHEQVAKLREVA